MTYIDGELCGLLDKGMEVYILQVIDDYMGIKGGKKIRRNTYNTVH